MLSVLILTQPTSHHSTMSAPDFCHSMTFGPRDEDISPLHARQFLQCDSCGEECSSYILLDRWTVGFSEHKTGLVFCDSTCLNRDASDYLNASFYEGHIDDKHTLIVARLPDDDPDYRCGNCSTECSNVFSMTRPLPDQLKEQTLAFCDNHCHSAFARKYFTSAFENGYIENTCHKRTNRKS